ncbi:MAG TPA: cytochrome c oxidase assembly protein [Gemmatimonadales bacterium]
MSWWCSATGQAWEWTWRAYPGVWLFVLALAAGYWRVIRVGGPAERRRAVRLGGTGLLLVWLLLDWPIGTLGAGYLVSVHALQFLGLAFIAPPLLLAGVPGTRWARLARSAGPAGTLRVLTHPLLTGVLFNFIVLTTHLPMVVDPLMARQAGAFLIDLAWLGGGLLFWWPIVAPVPARTGGALAKIGYLFAGTLFHTAIGMWLLLSRWPVYEVYELAPPIGGRSVLVDQGIAGGFMELLGGVIIIGSIAVLFFRWAGREAAEARAEP